MDDLLSRVRTVLEATPLRWTSLMELLPQDLLTLAPAPGEWSALECLVHILDTERGVFPVRVQAFLAGQDFPGFNPDAEGSDAGSQSPMALAIEFARLRQENLALLEQVKPADLERRARHAELGMVTLAQLLNEWATHDLNHTVQAERALMQPFLQGCGPWQMYFTDHLIQK